MADFFFNLIGLGAGQRSSEDNTPELIKLVRGEIDRINVRNKEATPEARRQAIIEGLQELFKEETLQKFLRMLAEKPGEFQEEALHIRQLLNITFTAKEYQQLPMGAAHPQVAAIDARTQPPQPPPMRFHAQGSPPLNDLADKRPHPPPIPVKPENAATLRALGGQPSQTEVEKFALLDGKKPPPQPGWTQPPQQPGKKPPPQPGWTKPPSHRPG